LPGFPQAAKANAAADVASEAFIEEYFFIKAPY